LLIADYSGCFLLHCVRVILCFVLGTAESVVLVAGVIRYRRYTSCVVIDVTRCYSGQTRHGPLWCSRESRRRVVRVTGRQSGRI